jgi:hypothetical protein
MGEHSVPTVSIQLERLKDIISNDGKAPRFGFPGIPS